MIEINNLTKAFIVRKPGFKHFIFPKYRKFMALDNINLTIASGEIFGLLGPNGAGKTTLIKILCGLLQPTSGKALIDGKKAESNKSKIGLMLGSTMIFYRITGYDNLEYYAKLYNVKDYKKRIRDLAGFLEIEDWLNEFVERYSEGMKTKLALARALIHNPDILLLDEPTLGLDPRISIHLRDKLKELRNKGKTILIATHHMEEADYLCDRLGILNRGRLLKVGTPSSIKDAGSKNKATLADAFINLTKVQNEY